MDDVYRFQRLIYDATRKYYLLGRDRLIVDMRVEPGQTVLEIACGTGRNLAKIGRAYPQARLFGFDISEQMLRSAHKKLGAAAELKQADACSFDPSALFSEAKFDHIVMSYSLSMIPDWQAALRQATLHLADNGTLHIVDFGDQGRLPGWFRRTLRAWLMRFHVAPRDAMLAFLSELATDGLRVHGSQIFRGYAVSARLDKVPAAPRS